MKKILYIISLTFLFAFPAAAQQQDAKPAKQGAVMLRVEVENGKTLDLSAKDLTKFARRETKAKGHDGKESVYGGYSVSDILLAAGAKIGKDELRGKELAAYLLVEAADNYRATFAIAEIAPEFTDKVVLLADTRDGKILPASEGAWQIIVPDDKKHGRWVRQVRALRIVRIP